MFSRTVTVERVCENKVAVPCPIAWIDNFAMRNFTNDAVFDDTLPIGDGLLEIGRRVPTEKLTKAMQDWFRRKGYLKPAEHLRITENASSVFPVAGYPEEGVQ